MKKINVIRLLKFVSYVVTALLGALGATSI